LRAGLSLIEIMIAMSVLALASTGILSYFSTLYEMRRTNDSLSQIQALAMEITERISAADAQRLGSPTEAPWSQARFEDAVSGDRPPLTEKATSTDDSLVGSRLMAQTSGLPALRIYVEYYRGLTRTNPATGVVEPGVMDDGLSNAQDFNDRFRDPTFRAARRLDPTALPYLQIPENTPFIIRIIFIYDDERRFECYSAKRRPGAI
jgi:prepilin-type N-terminal cleavage/methylation domain-containing protein